MWQRDGIGAVRPRFASYILVSMMHAVTSLSCRITGIVHLACTRKGPVHVLGRQACSRSTCAAALEIAPTLLNCRNKRACSLTQNTGAFDAAGSCSRLTHAGHAIATGLTPSQARAGDSSEKRPCGASQAGPYISGRGHRVCTGAAADLGRTPCAAQSSAANVIGAASIAASGGSTKWHGCCGGARVCHCE